MSPVAIGIVGLAALLVLLVCSLPVAFVMAVVGAVGFAAIVSPHAALAVLASDFMECFTNYGLTVIPLFVFMGQVCFHTGISGKLFRAANSWFGSRPGGLAMATVGACAAFGGDVLSPELPRLLADGFAFLMPYYRLFQRIQ